MARAAGDYVLGAAGREARLLAQRLWTGPKRFGFAVYVAFALFGLWGMGWAGAHFFARDSALLQGGLTMALMLVYVVPLTFAYLAWRERAVKRIWADRGETDSWPMEWIVDETGFTIIQPAQQTTIAWAAVSEIFPARKHWLILANTAAHCVPKHCFADAAAERAFIAEALARLSPAARKRSPEAIAFAG
jgi:hypothetical protein